MTVVPDAEAMIQARTVLAESGFQYSGKR